MFVCMSEILFIDISFIVLGRLSQSYKHHYIEESGGNQNFCIVRVLSGWDYKITTRLACTIQQSRLYQELQEYLVELHSNNDKQSIVKLIGMVLVRMIANILVLGILAGAGYLMWYITITQSLTVRKHQCVCVCVHVKGTVHLHFEFSGLIQVCSNDVKMRKQSPIY